MDQAWLRVTEVTRRLHGTIVLDRLDLAVRQGAFVTVLGAGRSGKTALMDILAGFARPGSGLVTLGGVDLQRVPPRRRGFGVVMQRDALFPHLSLAQNVAYPLRFRRIARAERLRMVDAALELAQITEARRHPAAASPAECQRAALARATVAGAKVLLLDEPLAAQEQASRSEMAAMLRRMHRTLGATTILATSVASDACAVSDEVAVLVGGRIAQSGAPPDIYSEPATVDIAAITGEVTLLHGHVTELMDDEASVRLSSGLMVIGRAMPGLRVHDACTILLRPERIAVAPVPAAEMGEFAVDATVVEAVDSGDQIRLRVLIGAGAELTVKRPATAGLRGMEPGQGVAVAWQAAHALVYRVGVARA